MKPSAIAVHAALFSVAVIYAATYTLAKEVMPVYIAPLGFILFRITGALVLSFFYYKLWVREKVRSRKDFLMLMLCAFFGVGLNMCLFFKGLAITSPIDAALIMVTTPILVLLIGFFSGTERLSWLRGSGVVMGTAGAMLLITGAQAASRTSSLAGNMMVMINAACFAVYLVMVKPLLARYHSITIMFWTFLFGFIFVLPFGFNELVSAQWQQLQPHHWAIICFIIFFTTFLAYTLNAWGLRYVKPSVVGSYVYLQPVLGTGLAVASGRYSLHWQQALYACLIFAGVYLVSRKTAERLPKAGAS